MAFAMGVISSGSPITPVEATMTSDESMPATFVTRAHIFSATSSPSLLQVFALPLLHITACATPFAMLRFVTSTGAPFTRFWVYTPAAAQGTSLTMSAKSFLSLFFLMPQCMPPALKPRGAHTPPLVSRINFILTNQKCLKKVITKAFATAA